MGHSRSLFGEEEIIARGEKLEKDKGVGQVTAWHIHKSFDEKGNYPRVEKIWGQHLATRISTPTQVPDELPSEFVSDLEAQFDAVKAATFTIVAALLARQTASHVRQITLGESQAANDLAALEAKRQAEKDAYLAEIGRWRVETTRLADQVEELTGEADREKELRLEAEKALVRLKTETWSMPIVGERSPLVHPLLVTAAPRQEKPKLAALAPRRARSQPEARDETAEMTGPASQASVSPPTPDPDQLHLPV